MSFRHCVLAALTTLVFITRCAARTPLHDAALVGDVAAVQAAIEGGASLKALSDDGHSPLHDAAIRGRLEVVMALLQHGADIEAETWDGVTALHLAASNGHGTVMEQLLANGAKLEAKGTRHGDTPLHRAAGSGQGGALHNGERRALRRARGASDLAHR